VDGDASMTAIIEPYGDGYYARVARAHGMVVDDSLHTIEQQDRFRAERAAAAARTVAVCGGRKYRDIPRVFEVLDLIHAARPFLTLIHGDADGVDLIAGCWAWARRLNPIPVPADWHRECTPHCNPDHVRRRQAGRINYCPQAGNDRNQHILDHYPVDELVVFPGGTGTADMHTRARAIKDRHITVTLAVDVLRTPTLL
jgi:YspA, cpYpsA-related SLOG family